MRRVELIAVMTAVNDEGGQINVARDASGEDTIPHTMQKYKARNEPFMLVVDDNCEFSVVCIEESGEMEID
jgi:hypothetical protein